MRSAPPVRWVCEANAGWIAVQVTLNAAAAAVGAGWLAAMVGFPTPFPLSAGLAAATLAALASWRWLRHAPVAVEWNGREWSLGEGPGRAAGQLDAMIDLGGWLLLRFRSHDATAGLPTRWLATACGGRRAAGSAFRAALYSSAPQTPLASVRAESQPD